jgi:predicted permease
MSESRQPGDRPLPEPIFESTLADEVADELQFHLDMRIRDFIARGYQREDAERLARARFDDLSRVAAECHVLATEREHAVRRHRYFANILQDIHFALRTLRRRTAFALLAILPLALGIGAATAMYSVADGIMLRPLPFPHPDRLVAIWAVEEGWHHEVASSITWNRVVIGNSEYQALRQRAHSLSELAAWGRTDGMLGDGKAYEQIVAVRVTASLFPLLGIHPYLGRVIRPGEDVLNGPAVADIGYDIWQRRFNGDSAIIGRSVTLGEKDYTIVGVLPPGIRLDRSTAAPSVWVPAFQERDDIPSQHNSSYVGLGRLKDGVTVQQASAEVSSIITSDKVSWHGSAGGTSGRAISWQEDQTGSIRASMIILGGAVGLLLLIACVNVATLMFGEATRRQPEIGARTALGATPGRLARQLLTESLVIAGAAAVIGAGLGWGLTKVLVHLAPPNIPGLADIRMDGRVLLFTAVAGLVTGIAFGILPGFALLRWGRHSSVRIGAGQTARGEIGIQRALVAAEVALSLVMLIGSSLLGRSLVRLASVDPGFTANGLVIAELTPTPHFWDDSAKVVDYDRQVLAALRAIPGVTAASGATGAPFTYGYSSSPLNLPGRDPSLAHPVQQRVVLDDYFHAMAIPITQGRAFDGNDRLGSEPVAIISRAEAVRDFPGASPIGQRVHWQGQDWTVVGVAGDIRYARLSKDVEPMIYVPDAERAGDWMTFVVRGRGDADALIRSVRGALKSVNPSIAPQSIAQAPVLIGKSYSEESYRTLLGSLFGIIGAVLASIGMFGVIARTVARRTREAGIRVALGARAGSLTALMLRETAIGAGWGIALGVPAAAWLGHFLTPYLFGVHAIDPAAYLAAFALFAIAAAIATVPPARRAARVDPVRVLRAD